MPDRAALPRSLALADLRREPQVQRAADSVAANVEQPEDAFPALPFALFHPAGCDDALSVEIFELELGGGAVLFAGYRHLVTAVRPLADWNVGEVLAGQIVQDFADLIVFAPSAE